MTQKRSSVFIGSSAEGKEIADALQVLLDVACEVTVWDQGFFKLGRGTLETFDYKLDDFDFAVLILTADDITESRGTTFFSPRDNVLFELGLFTGGLGRQRTFVVYDRATDLKILTDFSGICMASFERHSSGNLQSALGASATKIKTQIKEIGVRDRDGFKRFSEAAKGYDSAAKQMQKLIELMARSRKVELEIFSKFFGSTIDPEKLQAINRDMSDLEKTLSTK